MAGFFHSSAFRHLAPGLAAFVNGTDGAFRLLISPVLDDEDRAALRSATADPDEILARAARTILDDAGLSPSALEQHTLDCLAYLLAVGRLFIRFVLIYLRSPSMSGMRSSPRDIAWNWWKRPAVMHV